MFDLAKIEKLLESCGWSEVKFAQLLGLDYSFIYRVMRGQRNCGKKFYERFIILCRKKGLDFNEYINEDKLNNETKIN